MEIKKRIQEYLLIFVLMNKCYFIQFFQQNTLMLI